MAVNISNTLSNISTCTATFTIKAASTFNALMIFEIKPPNEIYIEVDACQLI